MSNGVLFGYARVSTVVQNLDRQTDILKSNGVQEENIYTDKITGSTLARPGFDEMQKRLRAGDMVVTSELARLSRSTADLLNILREWSAKNITFISLKENIDISTPAGKFLLVVLAATVELEREINANRVIEGLEAARARGRIGGRPRADKKRIQKALKLYDLKSHSIGEIVEICKISQSTLYRELKKRNGAEVVEGLD